MSPRLAYAQARLQARLADLADEPLWQHLEAARGLYGYLEGARRSGLGHWLQGLSGDSDAHTIEQALGHHLLALRAEARAWLPAAWGAALDWLGWLPQLPLLRALLTGSHPPWLRDATRLGPFLPPPGQDPRPAIAASGAAPLLRGEHRRPVLADTLVDNWLRHWRGLWPPCSRWEQATLQRLVQLVQRHTAGFAALDPAEAWGARTRLASKLRHLLRRSPLEPGAVLAWLALETLELERLRGALVRRATLIPKAAE
jgi:hypothetical protein